MKVKISLAQVNPVLGDVEKNMNKHLEFIEKSINENSNMVVFPELSMSGYRLRDLIESVAIEATDKFFEPIINKSKFIDIAFGFVERGEDKNTYNSAMYASKGSIVNVYRKIYPPTHGMFEELRFVGRGDKIEVFDTAYGKVSMIICRDLFHPSLAFLAYAGGADYLIALSNMPLRGLKGKRPAIQETVETAALTYTNFFGNFLVYVNRVGFDDGLGFYGGSFVMNPFGVKNLEAPIFEEILVTGEINTNDIFKKRQVFPISREEDLRIVYDNLRRLMEERND